MPDFVGINGLEKHVVDAIVNFSYNLALGDLDSAFKAIKMIKKFVENSEKIFVLPEVDMNSSRASSSDFFI